ncbi:MAG: hypothetical protein KF830_10120 [Planctomycetes bacterium]|nr:hypothetical protein [Planctomycetota bacterium]
MSLAAITTLQRQLGEWADRDANQRFLQRDQEAQLEAALGDRRRRTQVHVAAWMLGTWHLGRGFHRVLAGEAAGFDEARCGQGLRRGSLRLRLAHQAPDRGGQPFALPQAALTALLGLALGDPGVEPLLDHLRALPEAAFGADDGLPRFTRELLRLRAGERATVTGRLGPYEALLAHWSGDGRMFAQRIADLLDLQLAAAASSRAPFDDPGARLYPVVAAAIRQVREDLGLPTPKVDHPLLHTNLGTMRPIGPWPPHPLLRRLELELRRA